MDLRTALRKARYFVIYGEPNGDTGSYEPLKATYNEEEDVWVVTCAYTVNGAERTAKVEIDDDSKEIVGFEVLEA